MFFSKASHAINGPYDPIPFDPKVSTMIDWEGELAVVIGSRGRNIAEADAMNHVFGWSVINDTTARDVQYTRHGGQWFKGKSLDGHAPMGPCIVVKGTLDPENLKLTTRVNGVVKQEANTSQMFFRCRRSSRNCRSALRWSPAISLRQARRPGSATPALHKSSLSPAM